MKLLLQSIKWDAYLIYKYGIVAVAATITAIYCVSFLMADTEGLERVVSVLVFTDPVMYGFLFTAVMVLFEKDSNTHQVLAVTPLPVNYYLFSKAVVFVLLSIISGFALMLSVQPQFFHSILFLLAIVLSASLFVFIAVIGVSYTQNFNQFILVMPIVLGPACLPLLSYFNLYNSWLFYLIPTQACLVLFSASVSSFNAYEVIYAIAYLLIWNVLTYKWAIYTYKSRILKTNRNE